MQRVRLDRKELRLCFLRRSWATLPDMPRNNYACKGSPCAAARPSADGHDSGTCDASAAAGVRSEGREGVACGLAEPQAEMKPNVQAEGAAHDLSRSSLRAPGSATTEET
jgi:hypothetical protein